MSKRLPSVNTDLAPAELAVPAALAQALEQHAAAATRFKALSPSCRREYIEWIGGAKREETRAKRAAEALEMIVQGKAVMPGTQDQRKRHRVQAPRTNNGELQLLLRRFEHPVHP